MLKRVLVIFMVVVMLFSNCVTLAEEAPVAPEEILVVEESVPEAPVEPEEEPAPEAPVESEEEPAPEAPVEPEEEPAPEAPVEPEEEPAPEAPAEPEEEPAPETPVEPEEEPAPEAPAEPEEEPAPEAPAEPEEEIVTEEIPEVAAELVIAASAADSYGYVGKKDININITVEGGVAPYAITIESAQEGLFYLTAEQAGSYSVTYAPTIYGEHEITVTAVDANGTSVTANLTVSVAAADATNQGNWLNAGKQVEKTGDWREDVVAVAVTQLGYTESVIDYVMNGSSKSGYSIYGNAFGAPYSDWNLFFANWCLQAAGISERDYPRAEGYSAWVSSIAAAGAFEKAGSYQPSEGDLVFLNDSQVGIVVNASASSISVILGDYSNAVSLISLDLSDAQIDGYANTAALMERAGLLGQEEEITPPAQDEVEEEQTDIPEEVAEEPTEPEAIEKASSASVIGVWYDRGYEKQPLAIHATTSLDAEYLYLYMGDETLLTSWKASESNIDVYAGGKEWHVTYTFDEPGPYYLKYKASADGANLSSIYAPNPVEIERPAIIGVWYDQKIEKKPMDIHITTNLDMQYVYLYMGDTLLGSWSEAECLDKITTYATCKEWHIQYTFDESGPYYLWYKASADGVTMSLPFSAPDPVVVERPAIIGVWYDQKIEKKPMDIYVTTNLDMEHVYLYMGDAELASWSADECADKITYYDTCKEWHIQYTFDEPGPYYLWYKASADGVNMSLPFASTDPVVVERPAVISVWYDQMIELTPMDIYVTTNLEMEYLYLYLGEELLATWEADDCEITEYTAASCKEWHVQYIFNESGPYYLWYKASKDGVNMSLPLSPADPVMIERPAIINLWYGEAVEKEPLPIYVTTNLNTQNIYMYLGDDLVASWGLEDATITEYATCKDWEISHVFEMPGTYYLWYKASTDGVNLTRPYSDVGPAIIGESGAVKVEAPTFVSYEQTSATEATLTWNAVADANGYALYIATEKDGEYTKVADIEASAAPYAIVTGLSVNTTYWFKLYSCQLVDGVLTESVNPSEKVFITMEKLQMVYGDFSYEYNDAMTGVIITKYSGSAASVVVPDTIDNLPIVKIGNSAFEGNTTMTSVHLPATVEVIGARAFANCTNLSNMD